MLALMKFKYLDFAEGLIQIISENGLPFDMQSAK
jgi:hypothetical protein